MPTITQPLRLIGYVRVSSEAQVDGHGLAVQEEAIKEYAHDHEHTLLRIFREEGISGSLGKRPALGEAFEYIKNQGGVEGVVFLRLDRLARDLIIQEQLLLEFQKLDVQPLSIDEPDLCSKDPSRILFRQMKGAISEYEKAMITLRLSSGRRRKFESGQGYCGGNVAFGFRVDGDTFIPVPEEIAVVERIHRLRRKPKRGKQLSYRAIAILLNAEYAHLRTFNAMTVHYIAHNPLYKGWQRYGGEKLFHESLKIL